MVHHAVIAVRGSILVPFANLFDCACGYEKSWGGTAEPFIWVRGRAHEQGGHCSALHMGTRTGDCV